MTKPKALKDKIVNCCVDPAVMNNEVLLQVVSRMFFPELSGQHRLSKRRLTGIILDQLAEEICVGCRDYEY